MNNCTICDYPTSYNEELQQLQESVSNDIDTINRLQVYANCNGNDVVFYLRKPFYQGRELCDSFKTVIANLQTRITNNQNEIHRITIKQLTSIQA